MADRQDNAMLADTQSGMHTCRSKELTHGYNIRTVIHTHTHTHTHSEVRLTVLCGSSAGGGGGGGALEEAGEVGRCAPVEGSVGAGWLLLLLLLLLLGTGLAVAAAVG